MKWLHIHWRPNTTLITIEEQDYELLENYSTANNMFYFSVPSKGQSKDELLALAAERYLKRRW